MGTVSFLLLAELISSGNTDCKMYYNLTKNVYRFMGGPMPFGASGVVGAIFLPDATNLIVQHTVNEHASIEGHLGIVRWIHALVQNVDASSA